MSLTDLVARALGAGTDAHWMPPKVRRRRARVDRRALHLTMRDGVKIAIDVFVPRVAHPVPAIVRQTRYLRALDARVPIAPLFDLHARTRPLFLESGYAWIDVDVRGTGASTGVWSSPWSAEEVQDGAEVVDWIVRQPWSSGRVGSLGVSYDGTAADMLATTRHPAVRAVAPLFSLYDVYADVAFPGGIHLAFFTERWSAYNAALDRNAFGEGMGGALHLLGRAGAVSPSPRGLERVFGPLARDRARWDRTVPRVLSHAIRGVRRVDDDRDGRSLREATRAHQGNIDVHESALAMTFRDDAGMSPLFPERTIDSFSPHAAWRAAGGSSAAIYSVSGWRDGGYPSSAIKRFLSVSGPGSRLTLGPWVHSGKLRVEPFGVAQPARFELDADLLAFFDEHLKDGVAPHGDGAPVHYFTMVEGRWKSARTWPPPDIELRALHLGPDRRLRDTPTEADGADVFHESGESGTGERSRWRSLLSLVPGDYPDRRERDARLLFWETPPLDRDLEITGHPRVVLRISFDGADDAHLFAYLEDVAPDGRVAYVTEGQLRALFRGTDDRLEGVRSPALVRAYRRAGAAPLGQGEIAELELDLLPVSWLVRRGHRVRLAIAGADRDHFAVLAPRTMRVHRRGSRVELPIARG